MPVFYRSMPSSDFTDCRCAALKADIFAIFFDAWYQMIAATYALQDRSLYAMGIEGRTKIKALLTTLAEEKIETTLRYIDRRDGIRTFACPPNRIVRNTDRNEQSARCRNTTFRSMSYYM